MTVVLLAFLVLLLVGLAAYTRIETAIAGNTQRQAQARENALLALNVAVGQLQRYAGPDTRVTASAHTFGGVNGTRPFTGVWGSEAAGGVQTWLVSGNEFSVPDTAEGAAEGSVIPAPLAITPEAPGNRTVQLLGANTAGTGGSTSYVSAPLVDVRTTGVPGAVPNADTVIGRYAWWVGDQGVKAPVAVPDPTTTFNFSPYGDGTDQLDLGARVRQQVAIGAGAANASDGSPVFEPRDSNNANLVAGQKVTVPNQIAFLRTTSNAQVGVTRLQQNFPHWSPNNYAVLANTKDGGLRVDLSLRAQALGSAYSAWSNYIAPLAVDMEGMTPGEVGLPEPLPPYDPVNPIRRRYYSTAARSDQGIEVAIHPVLSFFGLSFSIRAPTGPNYEVSARCVVGLWNPYTAALVPPVADGRKFEIRITGLPVVAVTDNGGGAGIVNLQQVMGGEGNPLRFTLRWPEEPTQADEASWLPGRVYYWTAESNDAEPEDGNMMAFNQRNAVAVGGAGVVRPAGISHAIPPEGERYYRQCAVANDNNTTLRVELIWKSASGDVVLATYDSVKFSDFITPESTLLTSNALIDFAYIFRLPDSAEIPDGQEGTWLTGLGRDPRLQHLPGTAFVSPNGGFPVLSTERLTAFPTNYPDRLLDRATNSHGYNEDVPVFELPRAPVLSLGMLQHLALPAARPFAIGNPWGSEVQVGGIRANELFDRFFFSGLISGVSGGTNAAGELVTPNPLLKPLRNPEGAKLTTSNVRTLSGAGYSSKFFLSGGAFNLNSTSANAWASVLRGVRFSTAGTAFTYLDASAESGGTADDSTTSNLPVGWEPPSGGELPAERARFFRFSQSAQETFKADAPQIDPTDPTDTGATTEPSAPAVQANTHLFRRGMRMLSRAQVAALAAKIVQLIEAKHAADGPFRSMDEFLSPNAAFALTDAEGNPGSPRSLLEAAIADADLNKDIPEFSSQWLTQGDIMTALAPVLFPRSDTFLIRTYGEVVNPATNAREGQAWCEAIVQRVPEYVDASVDAPEVPPGELASEVNKVLGRRFKVVSFRWLTRNDI